jgi:methyl-accepting chemotaxis protein
MEERVGISDSQQKLGWRRLGVTMTLQMLLTSLMPLIVIAVVVMIALSRSVKDLREGMLSVRQSMAGELVGTTLQSQAQVTMGEIDSYMHDRIQEVIGWEDHVVMPAMQEAARDGALRAESMGLLSLSEDQVESVMDETRALSDDAVLRQRLITLSAQTPDFAEIFFTEEHGFTVAYNHKPSDFVQSDETWWSVAWDQGIYISDVEYDDSAGVYSVDICMRIEDIDDQPLGVLKVVLDVGVLQDSVSDAAVAGSTVRLFTRQGGRLADTDSGGDPALIMIDAGNLLEGNWEAARLILEEHSEKRAGYLLGQQNLDGEPIVVGYAFSAPGSYYDVPGFDGFDWVVTVDRTEKMALASLRELDQGVLQLEAVQSSILRLILGVGAAMAGSAVVVALLAARTIVRPIERLAEASQRVAAGDFSATAQVEQRNEIGQLQDAFLQMTVQLRRMLHDEREQREYMQAMIAEYMTFVASVARGDLTAQLTLDGEGWEDDPLVVLGHNLNEMVDNLRDMTVRTREAAQNLGSGAAEILAATTQQASGASEQSAAIAQTTTTVDELKTIAEQSVARAQEVASASQHTVETSRAGQRAVDETVGSMREIRGRVEGIAENILALSEQTQQIGEIIATVSDIAAQSNILALNASVEAARAGEYGKGFAVVAVEVRNLAEQSRQATAQVKAILSDIQKATNATVMATEEGTKDVEEGVRLAAQAGEAIEQLAEVIEGSAQAATQMVAGGRQQSTGVEQIAVAMQNINQVTVQALASTRQAEKAAQELNDLARGLTEAVEQYRL